MSYESWNDHGSPDYWGGADPEWEESRRVRQRSVSKTVAFGGSCFPYNTLIDTPFGKVKIGELKKGQTVLSYNAGKLVSRVITRKRVRGIAQVIRVEFFTGHTLFATGHHSFLTESGWKKLVQLQPGSKIICADGNQAVVKSLVQQEEEPVFNIYTAGEHNFIADGFVAHNFTEFRTLRTILHRLFLDPLLPPEVASI